MERTRPKRVGPGLFLYQTSKPDLGLFSLAIGQPNEKEEFIISCSRVTGKKYWFYSKSAEAGIWRMS